MITLVSRLRSNLPAAGPGGEAVPAARRELAAMGASSGVSTAPRERAYWRVRIRELRIRGELLLDHAGAFRVLEECLAPGAGLPRRDRREVEAALIHLCIETQPLSLVQTTMEAVLADRGYRHGRGLFLASVQAARLAERRGLSELAHEYWSAAWKARKGLAGASEEVAEVAAWLGLRAARAADWPGLARWVTYLSRPGRNQTAPDAFRLGTLQFLRGCSVGATESELAAAAARAVVLLRALPELPERVLLRDYTLELLYGLAWLGKEAVAASWDCLLPTSCRFERALWDQDLELFRAFSRIGLPAPRLPPPPVLRRPTAAELAGVRWLPRGVVSRLVRGYHGLMDMAKSTDARLRASWRQRLIRQRIQNLRAFDAGRS